MLKKLLGYFKKEIQLTKEYYQDTASSEPIEDSVRKENQPDKEFYHTTVLPKPAPVSDDSDEIEVTYNGLTFMAPKPISNEEYQRRRQANEDWLEAHYDLNTAKGIQSIPERSDLPRPPDADSDGFRDYTCDVDYYLRFKSAWFEDDGNIDLAILCLKKSNAIRMVSKRNYRKDDYYKLIRLLARSGRLKELEEERTKIDNFFHGYTIDGMIGIGPPTLTAEMKRMEDEDIAREIQRGIDKRDYQWLQENLPDICPKSYSGYKRMKNGNTKNYQKLIARAKELGRIIK